VLKLSYVKVIMLYNYGIKIKGDKMNLYAPLPKEVLKYLVGKQIVIYPLGNNRNRRLQTEKEQLKTITVSKVTRKNIECVGYCKFAIDGEQDTHNSGYYSFLTMEDALEYLDMQSFANTTFKHGIELSLEQIKKIYLIFKGDA